MTVFRKMTASMVALSLLSGVGTARADDWASYTEGYRDGYSEGYPDGYSDGYPDGYHAAEEPYYSRGGNRGDVGAALALGVMGGVALGAIAAAPRTTREVIVRSDPECRRTRVRVWDGYAYHRKRVLTCD